MSILNEIKKGVASSGSNKGKVIFIAKDSKKRVRFLTNVEDAIKIKMHDSFDKGINAICQKILGKKCPYCKDDSIRTRDAYVFSVWDPDSKEVKIFVGYANNFNPLPNLVAMYETYGTLLDRDYVLQRDGGGTNTRYSVVPMDKVKFKNTKAKPYTKKKLIEILDKAYPVGDDDSDDDDYEDDDDELENEDDTYDEDDDDLDDDEMDYKEMSAKELYMECVERGIKAKKKQKNKYYIKLLEKYDEENDEDEDDDEEDDW